MDLSGAPTSKPKKVGSMGANRDLSQVISKDRIQSRSSGVRSNPEAENLMRSQDAELRSSPSDR